MRRVTDTIQVEAYSETAGVDRYHNPIPGYLPPVDVGVYLVSAKQSVEPDELGRRAVLTGKTVYAPLGTTVGPHDRVTWRGDLYQVVGEPAVWDSNPNVPRARNTVVQFDLERSTG